MNVAEDDAAVDVRVPARRRRASDDEGEEAEFHDAAEYAASVSSHPEEHTIGELPNEAHAAKEGEEAIGGPEPGEVPADADEQVAEEHDEAEASAEAKKAKLREPFEVPTSGAFWLHDDRFGEEVQAGPSRPEQQSRKSKSDTEGRWLHDKFSTLELEGDAGDNVSENAFGNFRRGRGRGMRGGRGIGRGRGGRSGRGYGSASADGRASPNGESDSGGAAAGFAGEHGALPQRQPRAPRAATRDAHAFAPASSYSDDQAGVGASEPPFSGTGRGQGRSIRGGGGRGMGVGGRGGRGEPRAYSPEGLDREYSSSAAEASGGRGYGRGAGRGRGAGGRGDGLTAGAQFSRSYDNGPAEGDNGRSYADGLGSGRGRGPGRGRPPMGSSYERGPGGYERGSGRGRGDSFGGGAGQGRGVGAGRGPPPHQQPRTMEEEFPPLPGSSQSPARPPGVAPADGRAGAGAGTSGPDAGAAATGGVRRYSKMAGKAGASDAAAGSGGAAATEGGRARGAGGDNRASKLSAAAPTFEPTPAAPAKETARQVPQAQVPAVPAAFGAPLNPLPTALPTMQPSAPAPPPVRAVPEAYGAPIQSAPPQPQYMPHLQPQAQQQQQHLQPPQLQAFGAAPMAAVPQQGVLGSQPVAPPPAAPPQHQPQQQAPQQQQQPQYGAVQQGAPASYGSYNDMEAWFQDAYQKALATGMDPQQAYSAVQGYVQGMQMAFQTLAAAQQRGGVPGMGSVPAGQMMPPGQ